MRSSWSPCATTGPAPARSQPGRARLHRGHELRSPLTSVKGFTATLLAKWERFTDDQKRLMLETVNADADRVTRLITELLDIARIDSGGLEVHRQMVDLPRQVDRLVAGLATAGETDGSARRRVPDLPELWLDPDKIDQVLSNLVGERGPPWRGTVTVGDRADRAGRRRRDGER